MEHKKEQVFSFEWLPDEITVLIFSFVKDPYEVVNLTMVSKRW